MRNLILCVARRLLVWEGPIVAVSVGAGLLSSRLLPLAGALALICWLARRISCGRFTRRTPADGAIAVLAALLPLTLWTTALPDKTLPQVFRLVGGLALFYALVNWAVHPGRLRLALPGLALVGLGLAGMAPFSVKWPVYKISFFPSAIYYRFSLLVADTVHPNVMAGYLALLLPLLLAGLLYEKWSTKETGWLRMALVLLASLAGLSVLVLTKSRGAWTGLAAALLLLAGLRFRWGWFLTLVTGLAAVVLVARLGLAPAMDLLSRSDSINTLAGRAEIWTRAFYMMRDFPFTGIGMGTFVEVTDKLYPMFLNAPGSIPHAHNLFLQVAVDLGLPGLVAWLVIFYLAAQAAWRAFRGGQRLGAGWLAGLGAGLMGSQLALVVHGLTDAVTWGMVRPAPLVWALWGLAMAAAGYAASAAEGAS
jgi:putative inorganic carbon (HCO3(-)) transporter